VRRTHSEILPDESSAGSSLVGQGFALGPRPYWGAAFTTVDSKFEKVRFGDVDDAPFEALHLCVDPGREPLAERIDARCKAMIEGGLLQEVRALRARGYAADLRPMQAIGYRHVQPVVDGSDTLANALVAMQADTRRFARRQRTWLRKVPEAIWVDPADREAIMERVAAFLA